MRFALAACVLVALIGCGKPAAEAPTAPPEAKAYEDYRAGLFSLQAAQESLAEALNASKHLMGDVAQGSEVSAGLEDIVYTVDSAGNTIADHVVEPPTEGDFNASFARHDDARLKSIEALNDALVDLRAANGVAREMASRIAGMQGALQNLADLMDVAEEDLLSALRSFGGNDVGIPTS